jgi:predicted nucleic acid-binding protein
VIVVSDSSPLIAFARIGCLEHLPKLFERPAISAEVYSEVVIAGAGLPGAAQVSCAPWIDVIPIQNVETLSGALKTTGLGVGELSTVVLAAELSADLVPIDERRARRYAAGKGLSVMGCVRMLEFSMSGVSSPIWLEFTANC